MKHYRAIVEIEVDETSQALETYHPRGTPIKQVLTDEIDSWLRSLDYVNDVPYVSVDEDMA